ncbi:MAG: DUF47 domain-containing protein [Candidatus Nealsonbacteria bacterium]|nr:MAG: DUF47 domain-containing protein [Candidatus Nealsonbacteria bacterium]
MGLKEFFFPKKRDFLKMLADQSEKTLSGMRALRDFMKEPSPANAGRVKEIETEADELRYLLINELNRAFVTPIDREDIFALSRAVDDIIDYGQRTVEEMGIYEVKPTFYMQRMVEVLLGATENINQAILALKKPCPAILKYLLRTKKAENHIEHLYHEALVELFKSKDTIRILKIRELYRHLSNSADRCDEAANIISDIVIKIT